MSVARGSLIRLAASVGLSGFRSPPIPPCGSGSRLVNSARGINAALAIATRRHRGRSGLRDSPQTTKPGETNVNESGVDYGKMAGAVMVAAHFIVTVWSLFWKKEESGYGES